MCIRDRFYSPLISDWRNFESWEEAGSPTALDKAEGLVTTLLAEYEKPPMADSVQAAIVDFVGRRVSEGGVETDY